MRETTTHGLPAAVGAALVLLACSPRTQAFQLQSAHPGVARYKIICEKSIKHCLSRAKKSCNGDFTELDRTESRTQPKRITSEPGPRSVGPRYQHERWYGTLLIECGAGSSGPQVPQASPPSAPERLCIPGSTQACLGPGACRGAQACTPEGSGYSVCDCGQASKANP